MCKISIQFSTEVNVKLCPYIKKTVSSHGANSTVYRSHRDVFQETHFLLFYSLHCTSHGVYDPFLSFGNRHLERIKHQDYMKMGS
jgi:hypothetical protein